VRALGMFWLVWSCARAIGETAMLFAGCAWYIHGPAAVFQLAMFAYGCWWFNRHCSNTQPHVQPGREAGGL
jgi:hypothetical protein